MSKTTVVLLLGGGGHAMVVGDAARASGFQIAGCLDDEPGIAQHAAEVGIKRLGGLADLAKATGDLPDDLIIHAAFGDGVLRRQWLDEAGATCPRALLTPIIHPSAIISPSARIENGAFIGPLAIINARTIIGRGAIVNSGAIVEHDCFIGPYAHIAPGAIVLGAATIGEDAIIGGGAKVLPGLNIETASTIGAGAVVTTNIPSHTTAIGVPAKVVITTES